MIHTISVLYIISCVTFNDFPPLSLTFPFLHVFVQRVLALYPSLYIHRIPTVFCLFIVALSWALVYVVSSTVFCSGLGSH